MDDLENSSLTGKYDLAIVVLVLEHVDWRLAVASLARLSGGRIFCVIQENSVLTAARVPAGSMRVLSEFRPQLVDRDELEGEFRDRGFSLQRVSLREVADAKRMVGLEFIARSRDAE